jgi:hypothetical protein
LVSFSTIGIVKEAGKAEDAEELEAMVDVEERRGSDIM